MSIQKFVAMIQYGKQIGTQAKNGARCFARTKNGVTTYTTLDEKFNLIKTKAIEKSGNCAAKAVVKDAKGQVTDVFQKSDRSSGGYDIVHTTYDNNILNRYGNPTEAYVSSTVVCKETGEKYVRTVSDSGRNVRVTSITEDGMKTVKSYTMEEYKDMCSQDLRFNLFDDKRFARHPFICES